MPSSVFSKRGAGGDADLGLRNTEQDSQPELGRRLEGK